MPVPGDLAIRVAHGPPSTAAENTDPPGRATHDPLVRFEAWLAARGWLRSDEAQRIREAYDREAAEAADWAEQQRDPSPEDLETNVFA